MTEHSKEFQKGYGKELDKFCLPQDIREHFQIEKCLKDGQNCWTVKARDALLGRPCVIKWATGGNAANLEREYEILSELEKERLHGFPRAYRIVRDGEGAYFIREYIDGKSLFEITEETGGMPEGSVYELGRELCRMIQQLQDMEKPLIHRDIKPENIVLTETGEMYLVDFGTARRYREGGSGDTIVMGSRGTAAPEQYGYMQTDLRTDIYAVGRCLWYMAAGCYEEDALEQAPISRRLRRIIRKAAAFDPQKRYKSAAELEKALLGFKYGKRSLRLGGWLAAAFMVAACVCLYKAGFIPMLRPAESGHVTQEPEPVVSGDITGEPQSVAGGDTTGEPTAERVVFKEKLIEAAVRKQLNLSDEDVITEKMLKNVGSIRIVGQRILEPADDFQMRELVYINDEEILDQPGGGIRDLSDLKYMPNLTTLVLCNQEINDISPLEGTYIQTLALAENDIYDISPLKNIPGLEVLYLADNPAVDYGDLGGCTSLTYLNLDMLSIGNLHFLEKLKLTELSLLQVRIINDGLLPILSQRELKYLDINNVGDEESAIIRQMDNLQYLRCWGASNLLNLTYLEGMEGLKSIAIIGTMESLEGIERLPSLEEIYLNDTRITDLSPVLKASKLKTIRITGLSIEDYTPLAGNPSIVYVECLEAQKQEILKQIPHPDFVIRT